MDDAELHALAAEVADRLVAQLEDPASGPRKFVRRVVLVEVNQALADIRQDLNNAVLSVERGGSERGERLVRLESLQVAFADTVGRLDHSLGLHGAALERIEATLADSKSGIAWMMRLGKIAAVAGGIIASLVAAIAWIWSTIAGMAGMPPPGPTP